MSRRVQGENKDTKQLLIDSAAHEFAENDYDHASLRQICSRAGVTTGALYFFFENKEDLLRHAILPLTESVIGLVSEWYIPFITRGDRTEEEQREVDFNTSSAIVDIYNEHRLELGIVLRNREQPVVREFIETLTDLVERGTEILVFGENQDRASENSEPTGVRWLAMIQIDGVLAIMDRDLTREQAIKQVLTLVKFLRSGVASVKTDLGADTSA